MKNGSIEQRLWTVAEELKSIIPVGRAVEFCIQRYYETPILQINIFGFKSYEEGTAFFRQWGIGRRDKRIYNDHDARTVLYGSLSKDIQVTLYCAGLPPSCRLVKKTVRVPKSETRDTGEFVEIERTEVVCGNDKDRQ